MTPTSLVIPTYNRAHSLHKTLESLARQECPRDYFDVIVVDDGSSDSTAQVCAATYPFTLNYIYQPNRGSAAGRNRGAQYSDSPILIFIDDDIRLEPAYVRALTETTVAGAHLIALGTIRPCASADDSTFKQVYMNRISRPAVRDGDVSFTELTSNNLSVKRSDFNEIGTWRDVAGDGQTLWGDLEFGYRAFKSGFAIHRVGSAVCYHDDYAARDLDAACQRAQVAAERANALFECCPELLQYVPMFRDKTPVAWGYDAPGLIARKLARRLAASGAGIMLLKCSIRMLESVHPHTVLHPFYRWLIGGYIYRGYRAGLSATSATRRPWTIGSKTMDNR